MKKLISLAFLVLGSCNKIPVDTFPDSSIYSWLDTCAVSSEYSTFCKVAQKAQVVISSTDSYSNGPTLVVVSNVGMEAYLAASGQSASNLIGNSSAATAFLKDYVLKGNTTKSTAIKNLNDNTVQVSNTASGVTLNGIRVQKTQVLDSGAPLLFVNQVIF